MNFALVLLLRQQLWLYSGRGGKRVENTIISLSKCLAFSLSFPFRYYLSPASLTTSRARQRVPHTAVARPTVHARLPPPASQAGPRRQCRGHRMPGDAARYVGCSHKGLSDISRTICWEGNFTALSHSN